MNEANTKNIFFTPDLEEESLVDLKGKYKNNWVEGSFDLKNLSGMKPEGLKKNKYLGSSLTETRIFLFTLFLLLFFFGLLGRVFYLQIIKGSDYRSMAEDNRQRIIPIASERGLIYDRNLVQLAKNIPNFSIALMPQYLPRDKEKRELVIDRLADITGESSNEIKDIFNRYGSYSHESIIIREDIDYETALKILIKNSDLPGIHIKRGSKRLYLNDFDNYDLYYTSSSRATSLAHILGYQGKLSPQELEELYDNGYLPSDYIGKTGVEKTYESVLRGIYGRERVEVDAWGKERSEISQEAPIPGSHLILSIDIEVQKKLEQILKSTLTENEKTRASAIALDPRSGEIIALVSLPGFDNNDFSGGIDVSKYQQYLKNEDKPLFNRAIAGTYPSGSTIKPAIAAAALQEGIINSVTSFLSTGGINVGPWFFPDWLSGGHGSTNVRKSLAWSVNTFYYYIGGGYKDFAGLGVKRIKEYLSLFGFGTKLGIDLPGEEPGFLPSKEWKEEKKGERWYVGDTYNLSIGQGDLLVTPLQIANMTATVANGGTLYKPRIVRATTNPLTKETKYTHPEVIRDTFISEENINTIRWGMKDCVDHGTCQILKGLPISIAGKTGTAQWSNSADTHAWFTSFAPFYNPEIVITVLIEEGGEGGIVAIPVAREFYQWWYEYRYQ
ncbi:MAG: penicillin-binding protein 2 [Candidatus Magasanikbacteria bacterium]|nr:penicillin-binding protein 2 [Candidatus Magasanikbacteria bacterium]